MPRFSNTSKERLATCHPDLRYIFNTVIKHFDCTIIEGHRSKERQNRAYESGKSQLKYPESKHNNEPSRAVDVIPYPVEWHNTARIYYFAGFVLGTAKILYSLGEISHELRWGGDWDMDTKVRDNSFNDLVHFELV